MRVESLKKIMSLSLATHANKKFDSKVINEIKRNLLFYGTNEEIKCIVSLARKLDNQQKTPKVSKRPQEFKDCLDAFWVLGILIRDNMRKELGLEKIN